MNIPQTFWAWYNKHYTLNIIVAVALFAIQFVHLYWLTTHVVIHKIFGVSLWDPTTLLQNLLILADYTEIPALVSTSLIYLNNLRKKFDFKSTLYITLLYSQFLHIFWITDEFVVEQLTGRTETILPLWLAWVAIMIDYLELPVIFDTVNKLIKVLKRRLGQLKGVFKTD
ncbi:hypothetical protein HYW42_02025 [Candidatus Daviesbacteria bacterium]|nr:hypothetical protein [Candidatus Daviesbacteria bacterium]